MPHLGREVERSRFHTFVRHTGMTKQGARGLRMPARWPVAQAACSLGTPLDLRFRARRSGTTRSQRHFLQKDRHDERNHKRRGYQDEHGADG